MAWRDRCIGTILGMAVGDSIGLPREGLSAGRAARMFGESPLRHRFAFGRGMVSDDTEHACMTAQALLASEGTPAVFGRSLSWRLRGWLVGVPAGIGLATLKAIVKLWCGISPAKSGVWSAGNGAAMRAPVLGVWLAAKQADVREWEELVRASTLLTHRDPRAFEGAMAIALAAGHAARFGVDGFTSARVMESLLFWVKGEELREKLLAMPAFLDRGAGLREFAEAMGMRERVSGYVNHTVPIVLYGCLRHAGNFRRAVEEIITLGGDADTTGAIAGGLMGAMVGEGGIPSDWLAGICEWPRSMTWMRSLGDRLLDAAKGKGKASPLPLFWPGLLLRNPLFVALVLAHGMRRMLPPY